MKKTITFAVLAALLGTLSAFASPGHTGDEPVASGDEPVAYGEPGNPDKPARIVQVTMKELDGGMKFIPNVLKIRTGEQVKFVIRNGGELDHELVFATLEQNLAHGLEMAKNPDMEHDDPNAAKVAPGDVQEIVWKFTNAGEFDFSCLIPGHREAGMFGTIVVQ